MWQFLLALAHVRLVVIEKGKGGFGVVCNSRNVITSLKGRAAADGVLAVGNTVVEVDGDALEGERLIDRIRSKQPRSTFTLGLAEVEKEFRTPPTLNQMMKGMMASPAFKKMATKMVVGMATGSMGGDGSNLLEGAQALLGSSPNSNGRSEQQQQQQQQLAVAQQQQQQLAVAQQRQQLEQQIEAQMGALLESDAFGTIVDKVSESPGIQRVMRDAESGKLCPEAEGVAAVTACLLDGGLLRTVADATCEAAGASEAECDEVHAMASTMLSRLGLRGDGWMGWLVRRMMLRPWAATVLEAAAVAVCTVLALWVLARGRARRRRTAACEMAAREGTPGQCTRGAGASAGGKG